MRALRILRILGWAVFLGMSWTWCIGMYLPALLVRDYGIWAFVVFAVPNVVGAAAMAWVLPDAEASRKFVEKNKKACEWFSVVTLLFNGFFGLFVLFSLFTTSSRICWEVFVVILAVLMFFRHGGIIASLLTIGVSIGSAICLLHLGIIPRLPSAIVPSLNLAWLALPCVFGLALCPYLDLTFHQARQAGSSSEGKIYFVIGFGVIFFSMLVYTLAYSGWLMDSAQLMTPAIAFCLGCHLLFQATLKLFLHGRAIFMKLSVVISLSTLIFIIIMGVLMNSREDSPQYHGVNKFELIYRCFMSFYALIFPAYVWICVWGKRSFNVWLVAVLIAAPMYWMGFIERQMIWLLPGVAVPLIAGLRLFNRVRPIPSAQ